MDDVKVILSKYVGYNQESLELLYEMTNYGVKRSVMKEILKFFLSKTYYYSYLYFLLIEEKRNPYENKDIFITIPINLKHFSALYNYLFSLKNPEITDMLLYYLITTNKVKKISKHVLDKHKPKIFSDKLYELLESSVYKDEEDYQEEEEEEEELQEGEISRRILNMFKPENPMKKEYYNTMEDKSYCDFVEENKDSVPIELSPKSLITIDYSINMPIYKVEGLGDIINSPLNIYKMLDQSEEFPIKFEIDQIKINQTNREKNIINPLEELKNRFNFPLDWLIESNKYILSLSKIDKLILASYTHRGDRIVNFYLRNKLSGFLFIKELSSKTKTYFPLFFNFHKFLIKSQENKFKEIEKFMTKSSHIKEVTEINYKNLSYSELYSILIKNPVLLTYFNRNFWYMIIDDYDKDLRRIIDNAPALTEDAAVFRGLRDKYYYNDVKDNVFFNTSFMSTSFVIDVALGFTEKFCCLKKILLPKGTKCVFLDPISLNSEKEYEILLPPDLKFEIIENHNLVLKNKNITTINSELCNKNNYDIEYTVLKLKN